MALRGGCLFDEQDFKNLQGCGIEVGDEYLFVIENTFDGKLREPGFRMKYPIKITWDELISGNFISATIVGSMHKEFFVFGETGIWGKYAASDYQVPTDIIGFQSKYASVFREKFKVSNSERQKVYSSLPVQYQELIKLP